MKLAQKIGLAFGSVAGAVAGYYITDSGPGADRGADSALETSVCTGNCAQAEAPAEKPAPIPASAIETPETYEVGGKTVTIAPEVRAAFKKTEKEFGIPYDAMISVCAWESDCVPEKVNPSSKACGLFQFMTNHVQTLYEVVYNHGEKYGYGEAAALVEPYVRRRDRNGNVHYGYLPVNRQAREELAALCLDPEFNATMWGAYQKNNVDNYNEWLDDRSITAGEMVAMNNLGLRGLMVFAEQAREDEAKDRDTLAIDFFKRNRRLYGGDMTANRTLIYNEDRSYKTVGQAYDDIMEFGSIQPVGPTYS